MLNTKAICIKTKQTEGKGREEGRMGRELSRKKLVSLFLWSPSWLLHCTMEVDSINALGNLGNKQVRFCIYTYYICNSSAVKEQYFRDEQQHWSGMTKKH